MSAFCGKHCRRDCSMRSRHVTGSGNMAKILLGVTGSVAAIKTPELFAELKRRGHDVRIVATRAAAYFFDPAGIEPRDGRRNPDVVTLDEDEWPGQREGQHFHRGDEVLHIEVRRWADLF